MPRGQYERKKKEEVKPIPGTSEPIAMVESEQGLAPVYASGEKSEKPQPMPVPVIKKLEALGPGQAYFEAPDGTVIIGEDSKDQVWYRGMNGGRGGWINRKR